ncbi:MAG: zinc ABC transporter substrate-binding protein [Kiloniellaceae bacterium]
MAGLRPLAALLAVSAALWAGPAPAAQAASARDAQAPRVVVSIKPLHGLVAGVMAGLGAPVLLVGGGASPHDYGLRPSEARALSEAEVIFWVGGGLETFLEKPLRALAGRARVVEISREPGVTRLPVRRGGTWKAHAGRDDAGQHGDGRREAHDRAAFNPHVWLDPANAGRIVEIAVAVLGEVDPGRAAAYAENGARLSARLAALDRRLRRRLAPVKAVPYVVLHDAYAYFERRYGLNVVGAFSVNPAVPPGARRRVALRRRIVERGAACVFSEPQFKPALLEAAIRGTVAKSGVLDPLGAALAPGPEAYFTLMHRLAGALVACLGAAR